MLEASKLLNIKTIVVYDLTRLGRDLFDVIDTYRKLLEEGYTVLFVKHPELNAKPDSPITEALGIAIDIDEYTATIPLEANAVWLTCIARECDYGAIT